MFALLEASENEIARFQFGAERPTPAKDDPHLRAILADYQNRRDELWLAGGLWPVPLLSQILMEERPEPSVAATCINALGFVRALKGSIVVSAHLTHPDPTVRLEAVRATGRIGALAELPKVEPFLDDENPGLRDAAIVALGKSADVNLLPRLDAAASGDAQFEDRVAEVRARIQAIESGSMQAFVESVIVTDEFEDLLRSLGETSELVLDIAGSRSRSLTARTNALRLLILPPIGKARALMTRIVADETEERSIRLTAIEGAGRCRAHRAVDTLIGLMQSDDAEFQLASIVALGRIGRPRAFAPLVGHHDRADSEVRVITAEALAGLGRVNGTTLLRRWLVEGKPVAGGSMVFVSDDLQLTHGFDEALTSSALASTDPRARLDAAMLLAFMQRSRWADAIETLAAAEQNEDDRDVLTRCVRYLRRTPD